MMTTIWRISCMLLVLGAVCAFARAQDAPPVIREVRIEGADTLPPETRQRLDELAAPLVGQPADDEQIGAVITAIFNLGVAQRASFRTETLVDGVRLVVEIVPNPVVQSIDFVGNTVIADAELLEIITTRPGQVLDTARARQDAIAIEQAYIRDGYTLVRVIDVNVTQDGVLEFVILEPTISEIRITGNQRTREETIRQFLEVREGDVVNTRTIQRSLASLQRLEIFDDVAVALDPGPVPGTVILTFQMSERRTGFVALGGTYNDVGGFSGYVSLTESNLFGRAQQLNLFLQVGARDVFQLSYYNPLIGEDRYNLAVSLYNRNDLRQAIAGAETFEYEVDRSGGSTTVGRPISPTVQVFGTLRIEHVSSSPTGVLAPVILMQEADVRSLAFSGVRDTRTSTFFPVGGSYALARVEQAGLFGGTTFTRLSGELRRFWTVRRPPPADEETLELVRPPWVLASRLVLGTTSGDTPIFDQFLLGGAETLRGFQEDRFIGEHLVLLNTEVRVPLSDTIQALLFVDLGDAWGGPFAEVFGDPSFHLRTGYGVGIRVLTPAGPLRLDFGLNSEGGSRLHFGIGPMF